MARIVFQGKSRLMPDEIEGDQLLEKLEVLPDHNLLAMRPDGNFVVSPHRKLRLSDGDEFMDAPIFEYGA